MKSYFEEFDKKYSRPRMERITVGFSGIDPAPKTSGNIIEDDNPHNDNDSSSTITMPPNDGKLYGMKNGEWVEIEITPSSGGGGSANPDGQTLNVTLTAQHIADKGLALPDTCDTSTRITVAVQGLVTERGVDWELSGNKITWSGLELESIVQAGDRVAVQYFNVDVNAA